jgi:hypothetical protein
MDQSNEVFEFLTKEGNLQAALEMCDNLNTLKQETHQQFWEETNLMIAPMLSNQNLTENWGYHNFNIKRIKTDWEKCSIRPKDIIENVPHLSFILGQGTKENNYRICWGLSWSSNPGIFRSPELIQLKSIINSKGATTEEPWRWVNWGYFGIVPNSEVFIRRMFTDKEAFIGELTDSVWDKFSVIHPLMEQINNSLIQNSKNK